MGGSSSSTSSQQQSKVTTVNRNLQNLDRTNIVESGGSLSITDGGAVAAGFDFGGKALTTVEKLALGAIKSSQVSQESSLKALDTLSRGDATATVKVMSDNLTKSAAFIAAALVLSKVIGGK